MAEQNEKNYIDNIELPDGNILYIDILEMSKDTEDKLV